MTSIQALTSTSINSGELLRFLRDVFPDASYLTNNYLKWCYTQNPLGKAMAVNAYRSGQMIGHFAGLPIEAKVNGRLERGLVGVHGSVRVRSLSRGMYARLISDLGTRAQAEGYGFLLGAMNAGAVRVLAKSNVVQMIGPLDVRLGFGSGARSQKDVAPQFRTVHDREWLRWRLSRPGGSYWRRSDGQAGTVYARAGSLPVTAEICTVDRDDVDYLPELPLVRSVLRIWIGLDPSRDWSRSLFAKIPMRFRPSPLTVGFVDLTGSGRAVDLGRIVISAIDFDLF